MNAKIRFLAIGLALPLLFLSQSCEKIKDKINDVAAFDVSIDMPTESIQINSVTYKSSDELKEWRILREYSVTVDLQKILDDNDLSSADFSDGRYESANVTLVYPVGLKFSFLDRMKVDISLNPNFDPGTTVAETETIPPTASTAVFNINPTDITPYINAGTFFVRVWEFRVTSLPTTLVVLDIDSRVKVKVKPL